MAAGLVVKGSNQGKMLPEGASRMGMMTEQE